MEICITEPCPPTHSYCEGYNTLGLSILAFPSHEKVIKVVWLAISFEIVAARIMHPQQVKGNPMKGGLQSSTLGHYYGSNCHPLITFKIKEGFSLLFADNLCYASLLFSKDAFSVPPIQAI
jgi:hypothetical protein